ncbi:MAG: hydrogenase, partial [Spirochaetes bacterium]|nr:hydrogenase [Spirochaetota bacterium]
MTQTTKSLSSLPMTEKPEILKQGKIPQDILQEFLAFTAKKEETSDIIIGAETGEDAAVVKGNKRIIISADPITFTGENIGIYTVAVNCNDIVAMGGIPKYLTTTILIPPDTHRDKLQSVFKEIGYYAQEAGIHWIGGHTEVTDAAARLIVSGQVVGFLAGRPTPSSGAEPGDVIVMTKWAGLEGTTILAREMPETTRKILGDKAYSEVFNWITDPGISILTEGRTLREINISSAHDPTEGGIATGIHEIALRSGTGAMIYKDSVFIREETKA